jgi:hypothetical protein
MNWKISELPLASPVTGDELIELVQGGRNVRIPVSNLSQAAGKSAYQLAVEKGFSGTVEEWLASLRGENGTLWYVVESLPPNGLGDIGDFCLSREGLMVYRKESMDTWTPIGTLGQGHPFVDAPFDGNVYLRYGGAWVPLPVASGEQALNPQDKTSVMTPHAVHSLLAAIGFTVDHESGEWRLEQGVLL